MKTAAAAVAAQLLDAQRRILYLEARINDLTAENRDLRADLYRGQQNRPAGTEAGRRAVWGLDRC